MSDQTTATPAVVTVRCDGRTASWSPVGGFHGDAVLSDHAQRAAAASATVKLGNRRLVCGDDSAVGALAALVSWNKSKTVIVRAPIDLFDSDRHDRRQVAIDEIVLDIDADSDLETV